MGIRRKRNWKVSWRKLTYRNRFPIPPSTWRDWGIISKSAVSLVDISVNFSKYCFCCVLRNSQSWQMSVKPRLFAWNKPQLKYYLADICIFVETVISILTTRRVYLFRMVLETNRDPIWYRKKQTHIGTWKYFIHILYVLHVSATHMPIFREVCYKG